MRRLYSMLDTHIDEWGRQEEERRDFPFDVYCFVASHESVSPMDSMWEIEMSVSDAQVGKLRDILDRKAIDDGEHYFIFPDRWLVPSQSQDFMLALSQNPNASNITKVVIVTHQPYIVGGFRKEYVRLLKK